MVKTEDGEAVDGKRKGTAGDDCVEDEFEGVEVRGVVAGGSCLDGEFEDDEWAIDEVPRPNSTFFDASGLDGCRRGTVTVEVGESCEGAGVRSGGGGRGGVRGKGEIVL